MKSSGRVPRKLAWPLTAMPLARAFVIIYGLLVIYASINPFDFDFQNGVTADAWWDAPLPRAIPVFDLIANVLAYIPLGFLIVFAVFPRWRGITALALAVGFSAILASSVETMQIWLPTRIPSKTDWWANISGGLIGALLAIPLGPRWLSGSILRRQFDRWFGVNWALCVLFLLFPWAQIYPQSSWLGMGAWSNQAFIGADWGLLVLNPALQEMLITAICWLGTGLLFSLGINQKVPLWRLLNILLFISVVIKTIFTALQFGFEFGFSWLTAGSVWGMIIGAVGLKFGLRLATKIRYSIALACLLLVIFAVNWLPHNPYFVLTLRAWHQGRLLHFNDLMQWVSWLWLPFALLWLNLSNRYIFQK